jgi:flavorubredoxin
MKISPVLDVTERVKWIGIPDHDIVSFDIVMKTDHGTTYNSYFINADKKTIVDTAKESFREEYMTKIRQVVNPEEIEYIVVNHTEPDHSGNIKHLLKLAPDATIVGSAVALNYLKDILGQSFRSLKVKDNDELDLGNMTLRFIGAPNLHWPDTIYTYLVEEGLLFTCDSFGCHFCQEAMFDDEVDDFEHAFRYYFDVILKPFSKFMIRAIEKIKPLDIKMILPGHGPLLRRSWGKYMHLSEELANEYLRKFPDDHPRVLIGFVSAYGYTREMALAISRGLEKAGIQDLEMVDLEEMPLGDMEEQLTRSSALVIGSPTINQNTLLPIYRFLSVVNPIRDKGKPAAAFGSYGWSGEAMDIIEQNFQSLKLKVFGKHASIKFFPDEDKTKELENFGLEFGGFIQSQQKQ